MEGNMSTTTAIDPKRYGRLPARKLPAVIRNEEENERLIAELAELDEGADLTPEEREYADLLTVPIEAFEDAHYFLEASTPDSRLRELMRANDLQPKDLRDLRFEGNHLRSAARETCHQQVGRQGSGRPFSRFSRSFPVSRQPCRSRLVLRRRRIQEGTDDRL